MLMSWSLSILQLRKFYKKIELYTDRQGKELFADILKLPYTDIIEVLDDVNQYDAGLWAIGKIYTYQQQDKPFLHLDGDILIWDQLNKGTNHSDLICLHPEDNSSSQYFYRRRMSKIVADFKYVPTYMVDTSNVSAINAGMIGGRDLGFFREYTDEAFKFVDKNRECFALHNVEGINTIFEQLIFSSLCRNQNLTPNFYLQESAKLYSFADAPSKSKIVHARSDKRNMNPFMEDSLYEYMITHYPTQYNRVMDCLMYFGW